MARRTPGLYRRKRPDGKYERFWRVRTDPLERRDITTGCTSLKAAEAWLAQRQQAAANPAHGNAQAARLGEWCDEFLQHKRELKRSDGTLNEINCKLGHWIRVFGRDNPLASIDADAFHRFVSKRLGEGRRSITVMVECRRMVEMLTFAKRRGYYAGDPSLLIPDDLESDHTPKERAPTLAELEKLWPHLNPRLTAIVVFGVVFGGRRSELMRCTKHDYDPKRGVFVVHGSKTKDSTRDVPVLSPFREFVKRGLPGLPLTTWNNTYRDLDVACRHAGIERFTPHDLRRTHASVLLEHGVDPDVVRRFLGHTTRSLVDRVYGRPRAEELRKRAEEAIQRGSSCDDSVTVGDSPVSNNRKKDE